MLVEQNIISFCRPSRQGRNVSGCLLCQCIIYFHTNPKGRGVIPFKQIDAQKAVDFKPSGDRLPPIAPGGIPNQQNDPLQGSLFGGSRQSV
jgi:hypothetical protein